MHFNNDDIIQGFRGVFFLFIFLGLKLDSYVVLNLFKNES